MSVHRTRLRRHVIECRAGCGACCTAPSISSPIPGMPHGKPAGVRCIHLTAGLRCAIFAHPERPAVCASLQPSREMCGSAAREAFAYLARLERITR
jgi:uncharacterized protein